MLIAVWIMEPFTLYIKIMENHYNNGTLKLESKDLTEKEEFKYNKLKDKVMFKVKSRVEYPVLALEAEIEDIKSTVTKTKSLNPGKGGGRNHEIPKWMKSPPKDGKYPSNPIKIPSA